MKPAFLIHPKTKPKDMQLQNTLVVKQEELQLVQTKMNQVNKEQIELRERGLMLLGAIEALQEQITIEELNSTKTQEVDDD